MYTDSTKVEGNKNKFGRGDFFFLLDIWTHILRNVLTGVTVNQEFIFVARANQHPPAGQHPLDAPYESVVDEPQKS